jgi:hypothetical protein
MRPDYETTSPLDRIKDAAQVGQIYTDHFLPRLHQAADQTEHEAHMVPFARTVKAAVAQGVARLKTPRQRALFESLCRHHLHDELTRVSTKAAANNRRLWDEANQKLVQAQFLSIRRWPLDEDLFKTCVTNGLTLIQTHEAHLGHSDHAIENRQAQFLSDLVIARLQVLAPQNIARASALYDACKDWIANDQQAEMQAFMTHMERLARAQILADCIVKIGPKEEWMAKIEPVITCEKDGDDGFKALLHHFVQAKLDHAHKAEQDQDRETRNSLLDAVLTHDVTGLDRLMNDHPHLAAHWHNAKPDTHQGLLELMRLNRLGRQPIWENEALKMFEKALGLCLHQPSCFQELDITHHRWNLLPKQHRHALLALQNQITNPVIPPIIAHDLRALKRLVDTQTNLSWYRFKKQEK